MRKIILSGLLFMGFLHGENQENSYYKPLTEQDKANMSYIIDTLSSHSAPGLLFYKSELERRGSEIDHLHVLQQLGYIFSEPKLAAETKEIGKVPWRRFARDYGRSLEQADKNGTLTPEVLEDFSKKIGVSPQDIDRFVETKDWVGLMNYLRNR